MSWPSGSTFNDPNAICRCETEVAPRPEPTDFDWGESCASLTAGKCNEVDCEICSMSWPSNSPYPFPESQDPYSMCRCFKEKEEEEKEEEE